MSHEPPTAPSQQPQFDISPEVVFRLGDELITDELQALIELVKNSYDASATAVEVHIDSTTPVHLRAAKGSRNDSPRRTDADEQLRSSRDDLLGWIEVRDNGDGMTRDQLDRGWLLISGSDKRTMKERGRTNRLKRTPLGDKGLGRLGVLRLGVKIEIRTRPREGYEEHILSFSRTDFERESALSEIDLHYERRQIEEDESNPGTWNLVTPYSNNITCAPLTGPQGTAIRVTGLNNREVWNDRVRLEQELLSLISPFEEIEDFRLTVYPDVRAGEEPLELGKLAEVRRDLAEVRWRFEFNGDVLTAVGRFKLRGFAPASTNALLSSFWADQVEPDGGAEYRRRLVEGPFRSHETRTPPLPWWLELRLSVSPADIAGDTRRRSRSSDANDAAPTWEDPGPFSGEIDSFSLHPQAHSLYDEGSAVFSSSELYRNWVRDVRGVKVFRDGFGVRVDDDFLGLGKTFTGGRSFFTLRPGNVVGYIALSARSNSQLRETTDREGFVVNPAYRSFSDLLGTLVDRINIAQTQIGRELSAWASKSATPPPEPPSRKAADLARSAADRESRTRGVIESVASVQRSLDELGDGSALVTPEQAARAREAGALLSRLQALVTDSESLRRDLEDLAAASEEVEQERALLRDQLRVAYQTIGLGIVAETVAHEMTNVAGRLLASAQTLAPHFRGPEQRPGRALVSDVRGAVRAIRMQLRHLEPQLRYQRARRESLDVLSAVSAVADYHRSRFEPAGIGITVAGRPFTARVNRGRFQQALDNLLINSEFWLTHAGGDRPTVEISVETPLVSLRDDGPGVDPGLETAIFEPFVSGRRSEQGRGLGLFIARQVLQDDDVTIYLGERDGDGRRRTFVLDFSAAIEEANVG